MTIEERTQAYPVQIFLRHRDKPIKVNLTWDSYAELQTVLVHYPNIEGGFRSYLVAGDQGQVITIWLRLDDIQAVIEN